MEKTKFIAVLSACLLLTACGGEADHKHTFASEWSFDDEQHWHAATCEHTDRKGSIGYHSFGTPTEVNGKKVMTCACGYTKDWNENYVEHSDSFSDITEFTSPVEIHTEAQKEYLEYTSAYTGEYKNLDTNKYPNGDKTISDPVMTKISWDFADHDDETKYSVTIGQKKDLSDGFEIVGTNAKELDVYNLYLGKNYYRVNAWIDEDTKVGSDVYELTVDATAPRNLYVGPRMTNCRDVGGRVVESGATIRQGLLLRTCGSGYDYGTKIEEIGTRIMTKELKVKTEINLNDSGSYNCKFDGVTIYDTFMDYKAQSNTRHHFGRNTENVKNVFSILSESTNYPVFFHCRIGTDRTGLIAILVNGVLGVPLNTIYQDYIFSNFGKIGSKRQIGKGDEDDITNYMNEILAMPGDTFQEKVYNTLITIGVTKDTIAKVQDILLDGAKPDNNKGQIVVEAKDMVLANATLKTEDKSSCVNRANPASYVTMASNATATITFNNTVAGNKEIYAYVGNSDASTSKKFSGAISVTVDNVTMEVSSKTFKECCMGNVNNRVNYYFVKLGDVANMSAGQHTIVVEGVDYNLNLGTIAVL